MPTGWFFFCRPWLGSLELLRAFFATTRNNESSDPANWSGLTDNKDSAFSWEGARLGWKKLAVVSTVFA